MAAHYFVGDASGDSAAFRAGLATFGFGHLLRQQRIDDVPWFVGHRYLAHDAEGAIYSPAGLQGTLGSMQPS